MGFAAIQTLVGVTQLSELGIDVSKNWLAYRITGLGNPVNNQDAATKAWVLTQSPFSGLLSALEIDIDKDWLGYEIGNLKDPTANQSAATKKYVDDKVALGSKVIWKDANQDALVDERRTASLPWTDLDLTSFTSAKAKIAILRLDHSISAISGTAWSTLSVRQNGATPSHYPYVLVDSRKGDTENAYGIEFCMVGMDANEIIEYRIALTGTIDVNSYIYVLGYIE